MNSSSAKEYARGIEVRKAFAMYRDYAAHLMSTPRSEHNVGQRRFLARWIEQRHPADPEDWWMPGMQEKFEYDWALEHPDEV